MKQFLSVIIFNTSEILLETVFRIIKPSTNLQHLRIFSHISQELKLYISFGDNLHVDYHLSTQCLLNRL